MRTKKHDIFSFRTPQFSLQFTQFHNKTTHPIFTTPHTLTVDSS
jgi:hypothetical protein